MSEQPKEKRRAPTRTGPYIAGSNELKGSKRGFNIYAREEDVQRFELLRRRAGLTSARVFERALDALQKEMDQSAHVNSPSGDCCLACAGGEAGHTCATAGGIRS